MAEALVLLKDGRAAEAFEADLNVPWWSLGKTIIAATALRLAEEGRLSLERSLGRYSLLQLLRHESGLGDYGALSEYHQAVARGDEPWSRREMRERAKADTLAYEPGAGWLYSNIGYLRARELVEEAYGGDIGAAARELVFDPRGLAAPRLALLRKDLSGVAMGAAAGYHPGWVYHGLFVGPLIDAARWLDALFSEASPLPPASRALMLEPRYMDQYTQPPWARAAYGAGLMVPRTPLGFIAAGHIGSGPGSVVTAFHRMAGPRRTAAVFALGDETTAVETEAVRLLSDP